MAPLFDENPLALAGREKENSLRLRSINSTIPISYKRPAASPLDHASLPSMTLDRVKWITGGCHPPLSTRNLVRCSCGEQVLRDPKFAGLSYHHGRANVTLDPGRGLGRNSSRQLVSQPYIHASDRSPLRPRLVSISSNIVGADSRLVSVVKILGSGRLELPILPSV